MFKTAPLYCNILFSFKDIYFFYENRKYGGKFYNKFKNIKTEDSFSSSIVSTPKRPPKPPRKIQLSQTKLFQEFATSSQDSAIEIQEADQVEEKNVKSESKALKKLKNPERILPREQVLELWYETRKERKNLFYKSKTDLEIVYDCFKYLSYDYIDELVS